MAIIFKEIEPQSTNDYSTNIATNKKIGYTEYPNSILTNIFKIQ